MPSMSAHTCCDTCSIYSSWNGCLFNLKGVHNTMWQILLLFLQRWLLYLGLFCLPAVEV
mgnify:CR=1 FL=1